MSLREWNGAPAQRAERSMPKTEPTVEQLWARPDLSLKEASRVTGRAPRTIAKWVKDKEVRSFVDGKYTRVLTQSIRDRGEKLAHDQDPSQTDPFFASASLSESKTPSTFESMTLGALLRLLHTASKILIEIK